VGWTGLIAKHRQSFIVSHLVKFRWPTLLLLCAAPSLLCGGSQPDLRPGDDVVFDAPSYQFAVESAYLLGILGNPHSYEVNANFLTGRLRWGSNLDSQSIFRGYNQVYLSGEVEPIIRGIENHYFGINLGFRYNFVRPGSRLSGYFSGGLGLGLIDSRPDNYGSQGQDFTFNILSVVGLQYKFSEHLSGQLGLLWEHFSNGGQTDPNPSLNLLGPQLGLSYSF